MIIIKIKLMTALHFRGYIGITSIESGKSENIILQYKSIKNVS